MTETSVTPPLYLSWTNPDGLPATDSILILRSTGAPVSAIPDNGQVYTPGDSLTGVDGENEVMQILAGDKTEWTDAEVVDGTNYHYAVYAYNAVINYSLCRQKTIILRGL